MKKIFLGLMTIMMCFLLVGCNESNKNVKTVKNLVNILVFIN